MLKEITNDSIFLPVRDRDAHKGDFGRVLLFCGSEKYTGAAYFSAQAAVNTGSGLVFLSVPKKIRPILASKLNEPVLIPRSFCEMKNDAVLLGCGLGISRKSEKLVRKLVFSGASPLVLDADAITIAARLHIDLAASPRELILTPHEGEFSRLVPDFDHNRREEFAANFAKKNKCTLVLKGRRTLCADKDGNIFANTTGNPGMATGGSGDVLTGMIASFTGQGLSQFEASLLSVYLHGRAGDLAAEELGEHSVIASDIVDKIPLAIKELVY